MEECRIKILAQAMCDYIAEITDYENLTHVLENAGATKEEICYLAYGEDCMDRVNGIKHQISMMTKCKLSSLEIKIVERIIVINKKGVNHI